MLGCEVSNRLPIRKRLYSLKELAVSFGATVWFWRTQIWDGALPYVKVGNKILVDGVDVDNFIEKNKFRNA